MRESTPLAIALGIVIGIIMGAANAYLGLKYSLTISASIPSAVISMAILRGILRRGTILENNIVQTIGSAGEALAAGLIFTVPALFILARDYPGADLEPTGWAGYLKIVAFGVLGGVLGVLMMVPMRRYLIVKQHDVLPFPEGTACAEVLKSGQSGGTGFVFVFAGLLVGATHKFLGRIMQTWTETIVIPLRATVNGVEINMRSAFSIESAASLLAVGFILGLRVSAIMVGGGLLAWLGLIPLISYFGQYIDQPLFGVDKLVRDMSPNEVWAAYIRYIGAGGVVFGGIISLIKSLPTISASVVHAIVQLFRGRPADEERTDRDLPIWVIIGGTLLVIVGVWLMNPRSETGLIGAAATAICGFIFVAVASRIVGYIGATSSPVSGMTIATLLAAGLLFSALGYAGPTAMAALIGVGAVVCIAIALAGDCSQDLKTGFLVGATPSRQQVALIIGVVTSAFTCAAVLLMLNNAYGFVPDDPATLAAGQEPRETLLAAQANVIALVLKGILDTGLPWELVIIGMTTAFVVECLGVPSLPFAVGLYLPLEVTTPIFVGGLLHWLVIGRKKNGHRGHGGILTASGMVAGDALMGLLLAGFKSSEILFTRMGWSPVKPEDWLPRLAENENFGFLGRLFAWRDTTDWHGRVVTAVPFAVLILFLALMAWLSARRAAPPGPSQPPYTARPRGPEPPPPRGRTVAPGASPPSSSPMAPTAPRVTPERIDRIWPPPDEPKRSRPGEGELLGSAVNESASKPVETTRDEEKDPDEDRDPLRRSTKS